MTKDNKKKRQLEQVAAGALSFFLALLAFQFMGDTFSDLRGADNASYLLLAKSIATGMGFSDINIPGAPPHTQYPPLFSLSLAPIVAAFGYNFLRLRMVVLVCFLASLYLTKKMVDREGGSVANGDQASPWSGLTLALLVGTNFTVAYFSREILPEVPYMFVSLLAVWALESFTSRGGIRGTLCLLALLAPVLYFTKFIGVVLCPAVLCVLFLRWRAGVFTGAEFKKRFVIFIFIGIVPFVLWMVRNQLLSGGVSTYQSILFQADYYDLGAGGAGMSALVDRFIGNLALYTAAAPRTLLTFLETSGLLSKTLVTIVSWITLLFILAGLFWRLLQKRSVMDFYILFYLAILLIWPVYGMGDARRYMMPITPFLYFYFFVGFTLLGRIRAKGWKSQPVITGKALIVPFIFFYILNLGLMRDYLHPVSVMTRLSEVRATIKDSFSDKVENLEVDKASGPSVLRAMPCWKEYLTFASYLREEIPPGAVIMTRKPEIVYLLSERQAVKFPYTTDRALMKRFIKEIGVTHIFADGCYPETKRFVLPYIESKPEAFELLYAGIGKRGARVVAVK